VALSFLYQLVRRFLLLVRLHRVGTLSKDAEIIVLSKTSVAGILRDFVADLEEHGPRSPFLLRYRDTKFTTSFDVVMASVGIGVVRTPVMAPVANAFAERWVRTVRQECLDHLLVVSRRQLEAVIRKYVRHYNRARPHRGLHLAVPEPGPSPGSRGTVRRLDILGGIIHEYERAA
jgi:putative transposase